jgi:hypothetical protein
MWHISNHHASHSKALHEALIRLEEVLAYVDGCEKASFQVRV